MNRNANNYPRDMVGYGRKRPDPRWPGKARLAVQFVINYEEGGENCVLHGDAASEAFLSEIIGAQPWPGQRHMNMESFYEYGSRVGFWRLYRAFTERAIPVTVFAVAMAMQRNPEAVAAMLEAEWEIASHGYRWIDYHDVDEATEREHMQKALALHTELTGAEPLGWYLGRTHERTRDILLETTTPLYDADAYADDLPYWIEGRQGAPHLIVPYTLDVNDMRFATNQGFNSGEQFFTYLKDSFDVLYAEGESMPGMMSVGLHCRLVGRPGRMAALLRFLDYVRGFDDVWLCTRAEIARHWHTHHAPA
ncbi:allantoinase PuuE [Granulosicoccaceae sp. 1_MG-2023]|nr:allantoinase PuuE [Granulosicoccaceae sp. 1_MG-2023]